VANEILETPIQESPNSIPNTSRALWTNDDEPEQLVNEPVQIENKTEEPLQELLSRPAPTQWLSNPFDKPFEKIASLEEAKQLLQRYTRDSKANNVTNEYFVCHNIRPEAWEHLRYKFSLDMGLVGENIWKRWNNDQLRRTEIGTWTADLEQLVQHYENTKDKKSSDNRKFFHLCRHVEFRLTSYENGKNAMENFRNRILKAWKDASDNYLLSSRDAEKIVLQRVAANKSHVLLKEEIQNHMITLAITDPTDKLHRVWVAMRDIIYERYETAIKVREHQQEIKWDPATSHQQPISIKKEFPRPRERPPQGNLRPQQGNYAAPRDQRGSECHGCGRLGHLVKDCHHRGKWGWNSEKVPWDKSLHFWRYTQAGFSKWVPRDRLEDAEKASNYRHDPEYLRTTNAHSNAEDLNRGKRNHYDETRDPRRGTENRDRRAHHDDKRDYYRDRKDHTSNAPNAHKRDRQDDLRRDTRDKKRDRRGTTDCCTDCHAIYERIHAANDDTSVEHKVYLPILASNALALFDTGAKQGNYITPSLAAG